MGVVWHCCSVIIAVIFVSFLMRGRRFVSGCKTQNIDFSIMRSVLLSLRPPTNLRSFSHFIVLYLIFSSSFDLATRGSVVIVANLCRVIELWKLVASKTMDDIKLFGISRLIINSIATPCLWNQLFLSLRQPHFGTSFSIFDLPILLPITSSSSHSPLCISITSSLFYSQLKNYLFHKSFPHPP